MFIVYDSEGKEINVKDKVSYTLVQDDMFTAGEEKDVVGIVIGIPCKELIQVQPKEGPPMDMAPGSCTIVSSLIQDILALKDDEELQKLIADAETRYAASLQNTGKKVSKTSRTIAPKEKSLEFELKL